ncbi:GlcG/HbpS family heme-binding protein [Lichenicoccus roseus]|uniref:Heme-binding protein n=1 Tax=Lichenicoccus roseus TaxID=2683649 RepID=A0A5R9J3A0_9PROT|nr:heme-binding protein [Lichenicoccus roseus]TLU71449.1 heme-binding protein [Lichenicoccus roseus]
MLAKAALGESETRLLMQASREAAVRLGVKVSIAVVDEAGVLLALERLDGARLHTPEAAWMKARTAAIVQQPTAALEQQVAHDPALLSFPGRMPLAGGMPVIYRGAVVGGVASSGAQPDQDEAICNAALAAFAASGGEAQPG